MASADLFDTHCHLTFKDLLPRVAEVMADARDAGVTHLLTVACRAAEVDAAVQLRDLHDRLWVGAGIHPHEAGNIEDGELIELADHWRRPEVVAAGEIGLDFHYDFSPRQTQKTVFRRQLDMARDRDMPIIIHCREAHDELVAILLEHGYADRPVVFHCFSGTAGEAAEVLGHGWWLSFSGILTFKKAAETQQACAETPIDRLLFETDSPYLSPEPVRKIRPNEPKHVAHTIRFAADLRGESFEDLARHTTANAKRFFRLD